MGAAVDAVESGETTERVAAITLDDNDAAEVSLLRTAAGETDEEHDTEADAEDEDESNEKQ